MHPCHGRQQELLENTLSHILDSEIGREWRSSCSTWQGIFELWSTYRRLISQTNKPRVTSWHYRENRAHKAQAQVHTYIGAQVNHISKELDQFNSQRTARTKSSFNLKKIKKNKFQVWKKKRKIRNWVQSEQFRMTYSTERGGLKNEDDDLLDWIVDTLLFKTLGRIHLSVSFTSIIEPGPFFSIEFL